jgi:hypothetical protein
MRLVRIDLRTLRLLLPAVALVFAAGLATAACGGGDEDDGDAEPTATRAAAPDDDDDDSEADQTPSLQETSVDVDQTFWHAGWKVTLGEARLVPTNFGGASVEIDAEFENLGEEAATFDSQLLLTAGGENYDDETLDQEIPRVPGGATATGLITFRADDAFAFDDATLTVGNTRNNQAIVPIGADGDDLVDLAPQEIAVTGTAVAGAVTVNVTGVEVRYDLPERHSVFEEGKVGMIVRFSVTVGSGIPIGEGVFVSENVALMLPDGTRIAVRDDGVSGVNEILQGKEGTTIPDLSVRFEIDEPAEGSYAFIVRGPYVPSRETVEGQLPFVVEPAAGAATPSGTRTPAAAATATP